MCFWQCWKILFWVQFVQFFVYLVVCYYCYGEIGQCGGQVVGYVGVFEYQVLGMCSGVEGCNCCFVVDVGFGEQCQWQWFVYGQFDCGCCGLDQWFFLEQFVVVFDLLVLFVEYYVGVFLGLLVEQVGGDIDFEFDGCFGVLVVKVLQDVWQLGVGEVF